MFDFLWILYGELDGRGRFRPVAWNFSHPDGRVDVLAEGDGVETVSELWLPSDRMAYYPLTA
jgi:hypothetical protein